MAGTYIPLENYLRGLANKQGITLKFEQIEKILNKELPPSAYKYPAWWANERDPHPPQKRAILNAGWKVEMFNLREKWIRLIRL
jgi:hypothetical protein